MEWAKYKDPQLTHWLAKRLVKTSWVSLPSLIAQQSIVPELIQDDALPEAIAEQLSALLTDDAGRHALEARFASMHQALQRNASRRAADAIDALVAGQPLAVQDDSIDGC